MPIACKLRVDSEHSQVIRRSGLQMQWTARRASGIIQSFFIHFYTFKTYDSGVVLLFYTHWPKPRRDCIPTI
jgi:hypothetical protein